MRGGWRSSSIMTGIMAGVVVVTMAWFAQFAHAAGGQDPGAGALPMVLPATANWLRAPMPVSASDEVLGPGIMGYVASREDTLMEIARAFDFGFNEMALANPGIDPWMPEEGVTVELPFLFVVPTSAAPWDLLINIPEMRLYRRAGPGWMETFPIGIGREGSSTPVGSATITRKTENPTWYPPDSVRKEHPELPVAFPPGPENPLGTHALYLSFPGAYRMHGTHRPLGVGRRVSHGCIRMYPEDIRLVYSRVPVGARLVTVNQPVKAGWQGDTLYLEVHPLLSMMTEEFEEKLNFENEGGENAAEELLVNRNLPAWIEELTLLADRMIRQATARRPGASVQVDWETVNRLVLEPDGVPHPVGRLVRN
jgi:L,D-transpeptidase ErfK/SrfK